MHLTRRHPQPERTRSAFPLLHPSGYTCERLEQRCLLAAGIGSQRRAGPMSKVGPVLAEVFEEFQAFTRSGRPLAQFAPSDSLPTTVGDRVLVDAIADSADATKLEADLRFLQATHTSRYGRVVSARLPIDAIDELAGLSSLRFARPVAMRTNAGETTSQGGLSTRADVARTAGGVNGTGVTVGLLSDSFDTGPGSYAADIASGDLPPFVNILTDYIGPDATDEGRAMAQLVYDAAPGVGLAFATAVLGQASMANSITDLRVSGGADVIVDDVIHLDEPMFQDGIIAQAANAAFAAGVPYFSSAGNQSRRSYESVWRAGLARANGSIPSSGPTFYGGVTFDFDPGPGIDDMQQFTISATSRPIISFQWDQPFASAGGAACGNELDVYILNANGTQIIGGSSSDNVSGDAVEVFETTLAPGTYNLMIAWDNNSVGSEPNFVKYVYYRGNNVTFTEHVTNSPSSYGHNSAAGAMGVAAAPWYDTPEFGVSPAVVESFSAMGGTTILFDTAGNYATEFRQQPDLTAPDGGNTTFFGTDRPEDADTFPNFFGTSAAAPEAAAVAALMRDYNPALTPTQIYRALQNSALDMRDPYSTVEWVDKTTGFGLIQADRALRSIQPTGLIAGLVFQDNNSDGALTGLDAGQATTVFLDANDDGVLRSSSTGASNNVATPVNNGIPQSIPIDFTGLAGLVVDVNVTINFSHEFVSEMVFGLVSPAGSRVNLVNRRGGNGNNFVNTTLDDEAFTPISAGAAPFTGNFRPEQSLSGFDGENPNGTWRLEINDAFASEEDGVFNAYSISITTGDVSVFSNDLVTGAYLFPHVEAGTVARVRQVVPTNYVMTSPAAGVHGFTVSAGGSTTGLNFGNFPIFFPLGSADDTFGIDRSGSYLRLWQNASAAGPPTHQAPISFVPSVTILTGSGNDSLTVDYAGGSPIPAGGIHYDGGIHTTGDSLIVFGGDGADTIVVLPASIIAGGTLTYGNAEFLTVSGAGGDDVLSVGGLQASTTLTINAGAGDDRILIGSAGAAAESTLDQVLGSVNVNGEANTDSIELDDHSSATPNYFDISGFSLGTATSAFVHYDTCEAVVIHAGSGSDTIEIRDTAPTAPANISGSAGGDTVNVNTDNFGTATAHFAVTQRVGALTIGTGGLATLPAGGDKVLTTSTLSIPGPGQLDLADNDLIVDYSSVSPVGVWTGSTYDGITGMVQSGRIVSSLASGALKTLGVAEAREALNVTGTQTAPFSGQSVDSTSVLVKFTWGGDANIDGKINIDDYGRIDGNVAQSGFVFGYFNGDFNFDGKINIDDHGIIDGNINQQDNIL